MSDNETKETEIVVEAALLFSEVDAHGKTKKQLEETTELLKSTMRKLELTEHWLVNAVMVLQDMLNSMQSLRQTVKDRCESVNEAYVRVAKARERLRLDVGEPSPSDRFEKLLQTWSG